MAELSFTNSQSFTVSGSWKEEDTPGAMTNIHFEAEPELECCYVRFEVEPGNNGFNPYERDYALSVMYCLQFDEIITLRNHLDAVIEQIKIVQSR